MSQSTAKERQDTVLRFILCYQVQNGHKPKWTEIMEACGIGSRRTLAKYLDRLQRADKLRLEFVEPKGKGISAPDVAKVAL